MWPVGEPDWPSCTCLTLTRGETLSDNLERVIAFRLSRQHIDKPLPPSALAEAASLGIQDTNPGSAVLALALRCAGTDLDAMSGAVADGTLVPAWGPRLASHLVPPGRLTMLTQALLADDEKSLAVQIPAPTGVSSRKHVSLATLIPEMGEVIAGILGKEPLTKEQVGEQLNDHLPEGISYFCARCGRMHPPEAFVRLMMWTGRVRLQPDESTRKEVIAPQSLWLPKDNVPAGELAEAKVSVVREFLRSYGPADAALFAGWAGIGIRYAAKLWKSLGDDLVPVTVAGQERSLLAADEDEFGVAQPAEGIVMLPAYDPFLQARDREIITPDTARQKQIWRFNVNPGVVLENGKLLALWRARRSGARLGVEINPYAKISRKAQDAMEKKAGEMAAVLGKSSAELTIGPAPK
jgi:hypothetical protein